MRPQPPKIPLRFLRWFCRPELLKYIEGDLIELFEENMEQKGDKKAHLLFAWEVVKLFRPGIIKSKGSITQINHWIMFLNNLKIALRVLRKEKFSAAVNVVGLAGGIWCALLTFYWCMDEYSYDRFHDNKDRLYRTLINLEVNGSNYVEENTAYPLGDALVKEFPEVVDRTRYSYAEPVAVTINGQFAEHDLASADPNFFSTFSIVLLEGSTESCMSDLKNIVISEKIAKAYFKDKSPVGERITLHEGPHSIKFLVSGVFKDFPTNSSIQFDLVIPIDNLLALYEDMNTWGSTWFATYLLVNDQFDPEEFGAKIKDYPMQKSGMDWYELVIQKYADQHLYGKLENGQVVGGRIDTLILFMVIAGFTLLIACFNYINLTTARAIRRNKEVGIRKIVGANKSVLISQFMIESGLIIFIAIMIGVGWTYLSLPFFNAVIGKNIHMNLLDVTFYQLLGSVFMVTLLVSGLYPAVSLSKSGNFFKMKSFTEHISSGWIRKGLVTFQFSISIMLISGTFIIYEQLSFILEKDLGLDQESILYLELDQQSQSKYKEIKASLANHPAIQMASGASHDFIGPSLGFTSDVNWRLKPEENNNWIGIQDVDVEMLRLLKVEMKKGTYFSEETHTDSTKYIINETAAALMGFEDPVGESLEFWGTRGTIVGVARDYHFSSLHEPILPLVIRNVLNPQYVFVRTRTGHTKEAINSLEKVHSEFSELPAKLHFMNREIEAKYTDERTMQKLAYSFAVLALIICALGLIGLVSYSIDRKIKEIAVRKVLDASLIHLGQLLFKEYLWLMFVAAVIGVPIFLKWSGDWLESYPYRIEVSPGVILLSVLSLFTLASLIIGAYMRKVQAYNPADLLRDE